MKKQIILPANKTPISAPLTDDELRKLPVSKDGLLDVVVKVEISEIVEQTTCLRDMNRLLERAVYAGEPEDIMLHYWRVIGGDKADGVHLAVAFYRIGMEDW